MSHASRIPTTNGLLASLPAEDIAYLSTFLRTEQPPVGQVLVDALDSGTEIWFPHSGAIALSSTDASGRGVQTGLVGREGCVGLHAAFDGRVPGADAAVQITGEMSVIAAAQLRTAMTALPRLQMALTRFLCGFSAQSLQTIACNRLHSLQARCCRWLLLMQDKARSNDLPVTQEALANLLGGGRPRINGLLGTLESQGLLSRHRGRIHLRTRRGLEQVSCECYRRVDVVATATYVSSVTDKAGSGGPL
jgi:CRP-like cAMP-binding protein